MKNPAIMRQVFFSTCLAFLRKYEGNCRHLYAFCQKNGLPGSFFLTCDGRILELAYVLTV